MKFDIFFYEVFEEEEDILKKYLPKDTKAGFSKEIIKASSKKTPQQK